MNKLSKEDIEIILKAKTDELDNIIKILMRKNNDKDNSENVKDDGKSYVIEKCGRGMYTRVE